MTKIESPKFTLMSASEPKDVGNYIVLVRDKETGKTGLDMDYWDLFGWDDFSSNPRFEVIAYTRVFEKAHRYDDNKR